MSSHDLGELANLVRLNRLNRGLSIDDAANSAGMSPVTWTRVERGQSVRGLTYAGVENVFGWMPGAMTRFLEAGATPAPTRDEVRPVSRAKEDPLIAEIWADPALTEDQKMALEQIVRRANADREMVQDRLRRSGRRAG